MMPVAPGRFSTTTDAPPLSINAAEVDELAQILADSVREVHDEVSSTAAA